MCVKRESFRHKGISVPLGAIPGFAVITVAWGGVENASDLVAERHEPWSNCSMQTQAAPIHFQSDQRGPFGFFSLRFWCEIPTPTPSRRNVPSILGKIHPQIPNHSSGCNLLSLDSGIFSRWTYPSLLRPSLSPSLYPHPPLPPRSPTLQVYVSRRVPRSELR